MSLLFPGQPVMSPPRPAVAGTPTEAPMPAAGAELDIMARLTICLDGLTAAAGKLAAARASARVSWEECHLIDIPPGQSKAAGVLSQPDLWGPRAGFAWQVLQLTGTLGPAGTSMSLYRDAPIPTNLVIGPVNSGLVEPGGLFLMPGRFLVWTSAGDALTVSTGIAIEIALDRLPSHLL